jgi:hypothetical protein
MAHRFSRATLDAIARSHYLWIRAGEGEHRFLPIWSVVHGQRLFIRSWNVKATGWHVVFAKEKRGAIKLARAADAIPVRAIRIRSERTKTIVDKGFAAKYTKPHSLKYVRGFRTARRRDATFELVPLR